MWQYNYHLEEKVQPNKPKHYTIYKTDQEEKRKCKKKKNN